jgi:tripartite-type tricarboxylate transporter receptor subunit TctC
MPISRRALLKSSAALTAGITTVLATGMTARPVRAQTASFPDRPVKVIMPFAAGNTLDISLRQIGELFLKSTGQPIIIENKPGGSGLIAAQACAQAAPDGYTLLLGNTSMLTINPHTFSKLPYDPVKSFRAVTNFLGATMVFAANSSVPANTLKEWIAYAKANPAKTNFASFTAGNSSHFAGVLLNKHAGIDMVHVPHNGSPPAVQNLLGLQVQTAFLPLMAVKPHVESGKIKVLAVTSSKRSPLLPNVPTFIEEGFPDLDIYIWSMILAPAGTPDAVISKLNAELTRALRASDIAEKWRAVDFEPLPTTPEEAAQFMQTDSKRWAEAVRISGFKAAD